MLLLQVPPEIPTLRERHLTMTAGERAHLGVLSEVITQVATLFEHLPAPVKATGEIEFLFINSLACYLDRAVPSSRNTDERLGEEVEDLTCAVTRVRNNAHRMEVDRRVALFLLRFLFFGCCICYLLLYLYG